MVWCLVYLRCQASSTGVNFTGYTIILVSENWRTIQFFYISPNDYSVRHTGIYTHLRIYHMCANLPQIIKAFGMSQIVNKWSVFLLFQKLLWVKTEKNTQGFCEGRRPVVSPQKRTIRCKEFPCFDYIVESLSHASLQWRHNWWDSVWNHQPHEGLLNSLFRRRSKKTSKLRALAFVWGIHRGQVNSPHKWPVTRKLFPFDDVFMIKMRSFTYMQETDIITGSGS